MLIFWIKKSRDLLLTRIPFFRLPQSLNREFIADSSLSRQYYITLTKSPSSAFTCLFFISTNNDDDHEEKEQEEALISFSCLNLFVRWRRERAKNKNKNRKWTAKEYPHPFRLRYEEESEVIKVRTTNVTEWMTQLYKHTHSCLFVSVNERTNVWMKQQNVVALTAMNEFKLTRDRSFIDFFSFSSGLLLNFSGAQITTIQH